MKKIFIFVIVGFLLITTIPLNVLASSDEKNKERDDVIGLFGSLLAPSIFCSAKSEKLAGTIYGRTITGEGEVPDFDGDIKGNIDSYQIYLNGRFGGFGATIGFGQGNEFEFSQPFIISVDYKVGLLEKMPIIDAAVDAQYSMIYLPDEKIIKVSAPGFGVFSINGLIGADVLFLFEPYAGLTLNYVYMDAESEFYKVWKAVPKFGLKITPLPFVNIGSEVAFLTNETISNSWLWSFGASVRF